MGVHFSIRNQCCTLFTSSLALLFILSGCAHRPSFNPQEESETHPSTTEEVPKEKQESDRLREQMTKLQERVQDLETRLGALNDKINLENGVSVNAGAIAPVEKHAAKEKALPTEAVEAPAAHAKVIPAKAAKGVTKKSTGAAAFTSNESVDRFREAKILFDSKKYSDAVLEFADFVKNEPDHALAPAAQYYLGLSYLNQKEYKLAEEELSRGLLSYSHSSYVPSSLLALSEVSEKLNKPNKVTYYKEKILANFPNSPQAKALNSKAPLMAHEEEMSEKPGMEPKVVSPPELPNEPTAPEVSEDSAE